jgi:hypothetical protein
MTDKNALGHLRSIDAALHQIVRLLQSRDQRSAGNGNEVADDRDLDGKYGDPEVKFEPRDWHGENCKGLRMSECPAEFLEMIAGTFDYFARKADENNELANNGKPVAPYKRRDAARARGWALRKRNGWRSASAPLDHDPATGEFIEPGAPQPGGFDNSEWPTDEDIPF